MRRLVEYSFDRDDYRPGDDSFRERQERESFGDRSRQEQAFLEEFERDARQQMELEAMREVVNNPNVTVSPSMIEAINDPGVIMMPNGSITRRSSSNRGQFSRDRLLPRLPAATKRTRRKTKMDKTMSKCLKMANKKLRKKNGQLRKGKTMADVMKMAHRLCKKE